MEMYNYNNKPIRRSQLISPWGVGAIVPFANDESLMIVGLHAWDYREAETEFRIIDDRLCTRLGVKELRLPPDFRTKTTDKKYFNMTIPAVRFPRWLYCPWCGAMRKTTSFSTIQRCDAPPWKKGRKCDPKRKHGRILIPERFIVVCPDGHIDDFPIAEWVHFGSGHEYDENTCQIRRSTGGKSASLAGIYYECSCGAKKSLAGATKIDGLKSIGYSCRGSMPWLATDDSTSPANCGRTDVRVLLRGATNVWFGNIVSSIYVPPEILYQKQRIAKVVSSHLEIVSSALIDGKINSSLINVIANIESVDSKMLEEAFEDTISNQENKSDQNNISEDEYRLSEYQVLSESYGKADWDFLSKNKRIDEYDRCLHQYFDSISLVPKLKETRAFVGFSRLEPKYEKPSDSRKKLSIKKENWLPAIQVQGEGLFFELKKETLKKWANQDSVKNRIKILNKNLKNSFNPPDGELNPIFVLIHTLAHLVINQISLDCGYGSASLRERIYTTITSTEADMNGFLIYTASGDSEGSLGGLVRQGNPGTIENIILTAIKNAEWCSSDPICISSKGQGPDSCNLAACYNCCLLSETSCEFGNRMLDRGLVVGTLENPELGYFYPLISKT